MLEDLRTWLNGSREYFTGVVLYTVLGKNDDLKIIFAREKNDYNTKRLQKELLQICTELKSQQHEQTASEDEDTPSTQQISQVKTYATPAAENIAVANPELYESCRNEAVKTYKEAMNCRAVLFASIPSELTEDPNRPDLVELRSKDAIKVVQLFNQASKQFDTADYVKINGRLPEDPTDNEPAPVPDHMLKHKIENLRKNISKLKKLPPNPQRIAKIQQYSNDKIKLEETWRSLQQQK